MGRGSRRADEPNGDKIATARMLETLAEAALIGSSREGAHCTYLTLQEFWYEAG